jgi:hypothetical protein
MIYNSYYIITPIRSTTIHNAFYYIGKYLRRNSDNEYSFNNISLRESHGNTNDEIL